MAYVEVIAQYWLAVSDGLTYFPNDKTIIFHVHFLTPTIFSGIITHYH